MARILVVDDESTIRMSLKSLLESCRHSVVLAVDGLDALGLLAKEKPFDLISSDYNMTGMTGLELFRAVRADSRFAHIPFIILSGNDDMRAACEKAGAIFSPKPSPDFIQIVDQALGSK